MACLLLAATGLPPTCRHSLAAMIAALLLHASSAAAQDPPHVRPDASLRALTVVDTPTLAAFYRKAGIQTSNRAGQITFETKAAERAGRRARREFAAAGTSSADASK